MTKRSEYFNSPWSKFAIIMTTITFLIPPFCATVFFFAQPSMNYGVGLWVCTLTAMIPLVTWLFHPHSYSINNKELVVHRPVGRLKIPLKKSDCSLVKYGDLRINTRVFASGGVFGYFGVFYSGLYGKVKLYTRNLSQLILIATPEQNYVIGPDNAGEMIKIIRSGICPTNQ